jgi:hypothetical protein
MIAKAESAARAEQDELARTTVSIIAKTRRHWAMRSDRYLAPETPISVGIGYAALTRDGETVYEEDRAGDSTPMTVAQAETLAQREADHDWRIHLVAQLEDRHYRREAAGRWVIYERGYGMS